VTFRLPTNHNVTQVGRGPGPARRGRTGAAHGCDRNRVTFGLPTNHNVTQVTADPAQPGPAASGPHMVATATA
jgi:hypothetical protein